MSSETQLRLKTSLRRARTLLSPLNLHWAGIGLLILVNIYILAQMAFLWQSAGDRNADAMAQQRIALKTAQIAALPLHGLDAKLARATDEANQFYTERLPASDSQIAAELGALVKKQGVRLIRAQYVFTPVLAGTPSELTEVRIDASLSGDYRPLVEFINSLERDKMFFVIDGETLSGQQSGTVNLRMRLTTYEQGTGAQHPLAALGKAAEVASAVPGGTGTAGGTGLVGGTGR